MTTTIRVERYYDLPRAAHELSAHWSAILFRSPTNTVFQTLPWHQAWWDVFAPTHQPVVLIAMEGNEPIGIAPLAIRQNRRGIRTLHLAGDTSADYTDLLYPADRPDVARALLDAMWESSDQWDRLRIRNLPAGSPTASELVARAGANSGRLVLRRMLPSPALTVVGREAEVRALRDKYSMRRPARSLRKAGRLYIGDASTMAEARQWLEPFFQQHIRRWSGSRNSSLFLQPHNRLFYSRLIERMLPTGKLKFSIATLDGHPIAFHFGFDHGGSVLWYKPSHDPQFGAFSPGLAMIHYLIDDTLQRGRTELDFSIGNEAFKHRFASTVRYTYDYVFFRRQIDYLKDAATHQLRAIARAAVSTMLVPISVSQLRPSGERLLRRNPVGPPNVARGSSVGTSRKRPTSRRADSGY